MGKLYLTRCGDGGTLEAAWRSPNDGCWAAGSAGMLDDGANAPPPLPPTWCLAWSYMDFHLSTCGVACTSMLCVRAPPAGLPGANALQERPGPHAACERRARARCALAPAGAQVRPRFGPTSAGAAPIAGRAFRRRAAHRWPGAQSGLHAFSRFKLCAGAAAPGSSTSVCKLTCCKHELLAVKLANVLHPRLEHGGAVGARNGLQRGAHLDELVLRNARAHELELHNVTGGHGAIANLTSATLESYAPWWKR